MILTMRNMQKFLWVVFSLLVLSQSQYLAQGSCPYSGKLEAFNHPISNETTPECLMDAMNILSFKIDEERSGGYAEKLFACNRWRGGISFINTVAMCKGFCIATFKKLSTFRN